tara:strand:- start:15 stop:437 length:423 start_codon:yes stop_codon:yes gene_type:complete
MATTTATITLASTDIMDNAISLSNTATLTTAGTDTGITKTTGFTRLTTSATTNVVILDSGASGGLQTQETMTGGKVFIQNLNDRGDGTKYVTVLLTAVEIGRLYGGDWCFFPWAGASGKDVELTPSSTTDTTLEYCVFYE